MPRPVRPLSQWSIIADLRRDVDRLRLRSPSQQVIFTHDTFTAAGTPSTTYPLTYLPTDGSVLLAKQGLVLREGTDYTVDGTTGIVTVTASQTAGDQIVFRYATTGELIANNATIETDSIADTFNRANSTTTPNPPSDGGSSWVASQGTWGIDTNKLYVVDRDLPSGSVYDSSTYIQRTLLRNLGTSAVDLSVDVSNTSAAGAQSIWLAADPSAVTGYFVIYDSTTGRNIVVNKLLTASTYTTVGSTVLVNHAWTGSTTTLRVVYDGAGNFTIYQDGVRLGVTLDVYAPYSVVDSSSPYSSGTNTWVGVGNNTLTGAQRWDNFTALQG